MIATRRSLKITVFAVEERIGMIPRESREQRDSFLLHNLRNSRPECTIETEKEEDKTEERIWCILRLQPCEKRCSWRDGY